MSKYHQLEQLTFGVHVVPVPKTNTKPNSYLSREDRPSFWQFQCTVSNTVFANCALGQALQLFLSSHSFIWHLSTPPSPPCSTTQPDTTQLVFNLQQRVCTTAAAPGHRAEPQLPHTGGSYSTQGMACSTPFHPSISQSHNPPSLRAMFTEDSCSFPTFPKCEFIPCTFLQKSFFTQQYSRTWIFFLSFHTPFL